MKRPSASGQTHLVLEPVAFLRRLSALIPPPRAHLVRYFGVFAPNARGFVFLHIVGKAFRDAEDCPEGVSNIINETMEPIVTAHVEAIEYVRASS
jgi:hypothetical protein